MNFVHLDNKRGPFTNELLSRPEGLNLMNKVGELSRRHDRLRMPKIKGKEACHH